LSEIRVVKKIPASPSDWTKNAYYTIKGVNRPVAICSEPLFIDCDAHKVLLTIDGIHRLGAAMALGIKTWGAI